MPGEHQGILTAKTQTGYIEAKSGRQLVYAVFLNSAPFRGFDDFHAADADVTWRPSPRRSSRPTEQAGPN